MVRPSAIWKDALWVVFGALLAGWGLWNAIAAVRAAVEQGPLVALFAVGWLVFAVLIGAGAWRRTVWGCRFSHTKGGNGHAPCPRHPRTPVA